MATLVDICLPVVINNDFWRVQRRQLQTIPEHIANALLAGLSRRGQIDFVNLGLFSHTCSAVHISGRDIGGEARAWLHAISHFRAVPPCHMHCSGACQGLLWRCSGLRVLHITGAERLQEDALGMLAPLAATLRELSLRGCSLLRDRAGHHLQALTQLTSLDIGGTKIPSGSIMDLRSLAVLSVREGVISGHSSSSRSFSQLQALRALDVSDTDMGNAELAQLQPLSRLQELKLTWTKVTRPPLVASLTSLEMGNVEVAPTLEDLDWLQDNGPCLCLESLQLPGATVEPRGEAYLRSMLQCSAASLTRLDLGHVAASSLEFLEGLSQENTLHTLNISGCQKLSDLHLLRHMTSLRDLDLSQTDTDDRGVFRIAAMPHLSRLHLRETAVTASALRGLADLKGLQSLDISHTRVHQGLRDLGAPGALSPRTLLAIGTKLSDRDVQAIIGFMGRQLQELQLGTSILEGITCLRAAAGALQTLVLAGCNCVTEERLKSAAGRFTALRCLVVHHCFLLTEGLAADVALWSPTALVHLRIDAAAYSIDGERGLRSAVRLDSLPVKQLPQRRATAEGLQAYDERFRYSRTELESIAQDVQHDCSACAALSEAVQSLDLAAPKI